MINGYYQWIFNELIFFRSVNLAVAFFIPDVCAMDLWTAVT